MGTVCKSKLKSYFKAYDSLASLNVLQFLSDAAEFSRILNAIASGGTPTRNSEALISSTLSLYKMEGCISLSFSFDRSHGTLLEF